MVCPGSPAQSRGVEDEESEFAGLGTSAHFLGEHCLTESQEPWQHIGRQIDARGFLDHHVPEDERQGIYEVDSEMANAVQYYMGLIQEWHPDWRKVVPGERAAWVELPFHCPDVHELFYGKSDFAHVNRRVLDVWDYKHGAGVVVEAENNPQLMYYAVGVLEAQLLWNHVDHVRLHIVQPRAWHKSGHHRVWETTTERIDEWLWDKCVPAMERAMVSRDTVSGMHCRFCPARSRQCPALMSDMAEWEKLLIMTDRRGAEALTPEQLGRLLELHELSKIVMKAALRTTHAKLSAGVEIPKAKLVDSRTNRRYKDGAEDAAVETFGDSAFTEPELKSPAQLDELPGGRKFTAEWAFKPKGGTTVVVETDPRRPIKRGVASLFKPV